MQGLELAARAASLAAPPVQVLGNQAGDLDSIVSAVAAAHLLRAQGVPCLAVAPFPRKDFRLRNDAVKVFEMAGWKLDEHKAPAALSFADEVPARPARVCLTDHNVSKAKDAKVLAIFDHHEDEHLHLDASPRVVDVSAGSACSLVARELVARGVHVPPDLKVLLRLCILVDTRNGKLGGSVDEQALRDLELPLEGRAELFEALWHARHDVSGFDIDDWLRLDYKEVEVAGATAGFSSVFASVEALLGRGPDAVQRGCFSFALSRKLDLLVAITAESAQTGNRGLIVVTPSPANVPLARGLVQGLQDAPRGLSPELLGSSLCQHQRIHDKGFGVFPSRDAPFSSGQMQVLSLRGPITRKTLLPACMEILARLRR